LFAVLAALVLNYVSLNIVRKDEKFNPTYLEF